jgi:hypothetical protein
VGKAYPDGLRRDRKALQAEVDRLKQTLEGFDAEAASTAAVVAAGHEAQVQSLSDELHAARTEAAEEAAAAASQHAVALQEQEQWAAGEIDALRSRAEEREAELRQSLEQMCVGLGR